MSQTATAPRLRTRDRLLAAAKELFQSRGFHGVGVADILVQAEAPKGCLYHHFPAGKDELGAAVVSGIARDVADFIAQRAAAGDAGATIVGRLAEMCARRMAAADFGWSPLIAAVAAQAGPDTPRLMAAVAAAYGSWQAHLEGAFAGEGLDADAARDAARASLVALEGAVVLSRARRDVAPLRDVPAFVSRCVAGRNAAFA